jgi:hypothetical protein
MKFAKLVLHSTNSTDSTRDRRDWSPVFTCMSINGAPCTVGTALVDTCVGKSYMTLPFGTLANRTDSDSWIMAPQATYSWPHQN